MPHQWIRDLPNLKNLIDVSLYYDKEADAFLVSGTRPNGSLLQMQYDGKIFRKRYGSLIPKDLR